MKIQNPDVFFRENCKFCSSETVHICIKDHPYDYMPRTDSGYVKIDRNLVRHTMKNFSNSLAAGIDGIPSILMKKCADSLSGPFDIILKQFFDYGHMPKILKLQLILPQHKSGALKSKPGSFRPISLTSQVSKLMEKLLKSNIIHHLESNNLLGRFQFGFRSGRSCLASLLDYYEKILEIVENGGNVDSLFLDFEKAFDKVDHVILCH